MVRVAIDKVTRGRVREICDELAVIRLDATDGVRALLPALSEVLELESVGIYSVENRTGSWRLDRWESCGPITEGGRLLDAALRRGSELPMFYNPLAPPMAQRNRVVDALAWIDQQKPGAWETSSMCTDVLAPLRMTRHHQPRALLCDGSQLLAWFGGIHSKVPTARQMQLMQLFVAPMRKRLAAESRLRASAHASAVVEAALERVGAPAFVIGQRGIIHHANAAGYEALANDREAIVASLRDAAAGRTPALAMEIVPIRQGHEPVQTWLAIAKVSSADARICAAVSTCKTRWGLTPKQVEVLGHVVRGLTNAAIAAELSCVERTVELHVTALLDRAGVDSRAALVARVFTVS